MIELIININEKENFLDITIDDNGCGMDKETINKLKLPFFTTKKERKVKVGLGISLLRMNAELTGGNFELLSEENKGTRVYARFIYDCIDRQPLGKLYDTVFTLLIGHQKVNYKIVIINNGKEIRVDTRDFHKKLGGIPLYHPDVSGFIKDYLKDCFNEIGLSDSIVY